MGVEIRLLGPFQVVLDGHPVPDSLWARRDAASLVKLSALRRDGQLHREQVMLHQAGRWREILAQDPADESAHLALMREMVHDGDPQSAFRQFESLDRALRRELGSVWAGAPAPGSGRAGEAGLGS